jgi:glycerol kinase
VQRGPVTGDLVLALDQGSHASRAVLFDLNGGQLAEAHVPVATCRVNGERVEQDADELVRSLQLAALDAVDAAIQAGGRIVAAGLATQRSTVVCWDRATGTPLTPALSWQDRRHARWLAGLDRFEARIRRITGLPLSPHYGASKLRWCLDHSPSVADAAAAGSLVMGPLSSYLLVRLLDCSRPVADPANASRTQLFDPATLDWSPELLELFGVAREVLPDCVPNRYRYGDLVLGPDTVPLTICTGDQSAAAFAFGRPPEDVALVNVGTGAFIQRPVADDAVPPDGILRSVLLADGRTRLYSHEGTVNGAGAAVDWLRDHCAIDLDRALARLPGRRPDGQEPPLFMNGVGGLGAPFWRADFPTEFLGDTNDEGKLVAVLESVAFLLQVNLGLMRQAAPLDHVRISGGLARSDYLCGCLANLSGLAVERHALTEATARGTACLAADLPRSWRPAALERRFQPEPDPELAARYGRWRNEMASRGATL